MQGNLNTTGNSKGEWGLEKSKKVNSEDAVAEADHAHLPTHNILRQLSSALLIKTPNLSLEVPSSHIVWQQPTSPPPCPARSMLQAGQPLHFRMCSSSTMLCPLSRIPVTLPTSRAQMSFTGILSWPPHRHEAPSTVSHTMPLLHSTYKINSHLFVVLWLTSKWEAPSRQALCFFSAHHGILHIQNRDKVLK